MYENHNPPTVVVALIPVEVDGITGLAAIKRGNAVEDGFDKIALIGGFQEKGETLQEAGEREVLEETNLIAKAEYFTFRNAVTVGGGQTNLVFMLYTGPAIEWNPVVSAEATEIFVWNLDNDREFAFPTHQAEAVRYLEEINQNDDEDDSYSLTQAGIDAAFDVVDSWDD